MSQRYIRVDNNGVQYNNLETHDILGYNGTQWTNIHVKDINPLIQRVKVINDTAIAESNNTYIINPVIPGIKVYLPSAPAIGDYVEIIDSGLFEVGFGTNNVEIVAIGHIATAFLESSESYVLTQDFQFVKFVYVGDLYWRITYNSISGGTGGGGSNLIVTMLNETTTLARTELRLVGLLPPEPFTVYLPSNPQIGDQITFVDSLGSDYNNPTGLGLYPVIINASTFSIQGHDAISLDVENCNLSITYTGDSRWDINNASY